MPQGNVSALATDLTHSGTRRILRCPTCETPVADTRETVFFALRTSEDKIMMALKMLLVRVELAGIGFVRGVTEATVLAWRRRAAQQAEAINQHLRRPLPVPQVHLDERWSCIARTHARETDEAGARVPGGEDGRQGVWGSLAPEWRLLSAAGVGPRTRETAKEVVAATKARVAGIPAFFSDGFTWYLAALSTAFPVVRTWAPTGQRGRPRPPVCTPHPDLSSGQWVKQKKHGTLRTLRTRVVRGAERLTHVGLAISTAGVERVHLTLRQALAPWGRKPSSCCKDRERRRQRVVFLQAFYHVGRPPMSVRRQLPLHERIRHGAMCPRWQACTPAMAAGVTDHVWTFRELLTAKFEPLEFQSIRQ
jgi:hypothetical protein